MDKEIALWLVLAVLMTVTIVLISSVFEECIEIRNKMRSLEIAIDKSNQKHAYYSPSFRMATESMGIKEYRNAIDIPMERDCLVTEDEMRKALLTEVLPELAENMEVIAENDFINFKKKYLGRIRVVEVSK